MTTAAISKTSIAKVTDGYRLQFEEAQDTWVLLYPEGMVKLNQSAAEILKRCDSERNVASLIEQLETDFEQTGLEDDVMSFLSIAREQKWISIDEPA